MDVIRAMRKSKMRNYIVPGLSSSLLTNGVVRLFEASREQHHDITPHSHRFDFACLVLRGHVVNRLWRQEPSNTCDLYIASQLIYHGEPGLYEMSVGDSAKRYRYSDYTHKKGEWYSMLHTEIHSITFSSDAIVLFFEGPMRTDKTTILEPADAGTHARIPTFAVQPWMFQPEPPSDTGASQ